MVSSVGRRCHGLGGNTSDNPDVHESWGYRVRVLFTTNDVPVAEGFPYWREQVRGLQMPFDLRCDQPDGFRAEMRSATLGQVGILSASSSACYSVRRTPALIRRSDPAEYRVVLVARGGAGAATARGEVSLGTGDLLVCDSRGPSTVGERPPTVAPSGYC